LIAHDLDATVVYMWWAQRRGFVRNTLRAQECDLWPGIASGVEIVAATRPYYRSSYVFVTRSDRQLDISSLADPRLRELMIGVQMVGNDAMNTPPAHALAAAASSIMSAATCFTATTAARTRPSRSSIRSNAARSMLPWSGGRWPAISPQGARDAGHYARQPGFGRARLPMAFDISIAVRKGDAEFKRDIDAALDRNRGAIDALLAAYHIPRLPEPDEGNRNQ
jgi:mxaJ protein